MFGFPHWQLKSTSTEAGVVAPDERLPLGQTMVMGVQHAVAMFGATVLMPMLMGLDPNLSILMSGIGTLLFFLSPAGACPAISAPAPPLSAWSSPPPGLTARGSTPT
jgi:putative pyrimidine permease RutG